MANQEPKLVHNFAPTPDGGQLSYYTVGTGPSLLILHGSVSYALSHSELAIALSPYFTVHLASRRARGLSSAYPTSVTSLPAVCTPASDTQQEETIQIATTTHPRTYTRSFTTAVLSTDTSDLSSLLTTTAASFLLSISSGALLTLSALLSSPPSLPPTLKKVILLEPPVLFSNRTTLCHGIATGLLPRFEREMAAGDTPSAAVTAMRLVELGPGWIPRGGLVGVLRYDLAVVEGMVGEVERLRRLKGGGVEVMGLGGGSSPAWMGEGMEALREVGRVKVVVVEGVGHEAACNAEMRGRPEKVVPAIREFFQ
ncbi:Alpha/Beta hydrolase protein [Staphylotrichum tortipilum]|uniref:Alpha/Beta hydrolase protein n=1 Tax=Staphylotrichum tortipilum TaxID=2831512 RepID=A0AAN6MAK6_9PEZI|nr:Alpha/Beta hydrolase protein [Staphylotrichum longicolle]